MNRFFDTVGDVSTQFAPWVTTSQGLDPSVSWFILKSPLYFRSDIAGGVMTVPTGFVSDLASIPKAAWTVFADPDAPFIELGAWFHDYMYHRSGAVTLDQDDPGRLPIKKVLSRKDADRILAYECMPELGAKRWQQHAVYWVLRMFGGSSWGPRKGGTA